MYLGTYMEVHGAGEVYLGTHMEVVQCIARDLGR